MGRLIDAVQEVNRTRRPEHDPVLRVLVLAAVEVSVLAVLVGGTAPVDVSLAALVLLPVGAWVSWRRRHGDNLGIKAALTLGAVWALREFFVGVQTAQTVDDTRLPLAALFVTVQVLHGFDLPQRRDLGFTLASSLTLVTLGATGTHAGAFGALVVVYVALAIAALVLVQRSASRELAEHVAAGEALPQELASGVLGEAVTSDHAVVDDQPDAVARIARHTGRAVLAALLAGGLALALLPRVDSGSLGRLPFSELPGAGLLASGALNNPGLPGSGNQRPDAGDAPLAFSESAYFGFAEYVDLRTVGELPDTPVLRVRSPIGRPWRGMVFDSYDGRGWTRSETDLPEPTFGLPVRFDPLALPGRQVRTFTQTIEVLTPTPNLIYGAADVTRIWIAGQSANLWSDGTISTSTPMDEGTVYSVESVLSTTPPEQLRAMDDGLPPEDRQRWLELPDTVTERTRLLALELTADADTPYAKAEAVEAWLGDNVEYSLEGPLPPADVDQVDDFLFERQVGWCEPIASSMVVLLRAADVPARFVTGFQPGDQNPLSRVWDVAMSDAHAWVEVWVPGNGWTAFDPTGAVPLADGADGGSSVLALRWLDELGEQASALYARLGPARTAALTAGLALLALAGWALRRRLTAPPPPATPFALLVRAAAEQVPMPDAATPREWVASLRLVRPWLDADALALVLADEEARRYRPQPPGPQDEADAWSAARDLAAALRAGRPEPARA